MLGNDSGSITLLKAEHRTRCSATHWFRTAPGTAQSAPTGRRHRHACSATIAMQSCGDTIGLG